MKQATILQIMGSAYSVKTSPTHLKHLPALPTVLRVRLRHFALVAHKLALVLLIGEKMLNLLISTAALIQMLVKVRKMEIITTLKVLVVKGIEEFYALSARPASREIVISIVQSVLNCGRIYLFFLLLV